MQLTGDIPCIAVPSILYFILDTIIGMSPMSQNEFRDPSSKQCMHEINEILETQVLIANHQITLHTDY